MSEPDARVEGLRTALAELRVGALDRWIPLPPDATKAELEAALGAIPSSVPGWLLRQPAEQVSLPGGPGAPHGITVWFQQEILTLVEARDVRPTAAVTDLLGPAPERLESGLGPSLEQWLYPERGLILHLCPGEETARYLYGFEQTELDELRRSPLRFVRLERRPFR